MPLVNAYATLPEIKRWVQISNTEHDPELEDVLNSVSRWIDTYCQRHFWQTAAGTNRVFEAPCDQRTLEFGAFNDLTAVTALATDESGDGTFETTWAASDYELLPLNPASGPEQRPYTAIRSTGTRLFPTVSLSGNQARVQVTGTWGWSAIPAAVHEACLLQSSRVFKRRYSPEGIAGYSEFGIVRVAGKLDSDVSDLLSPYRRTAVLVA